MANKLDTDDWPVLCTTDDLARILNCSPRTLEKWRQDGVGPAYIKEGGMVRYLREDIVYWVTHVKRHQRVSQPPVEGDAAT